jgi:hypothetical protein
VTRVGRSAVAVLAIWLGAIAWLVWVPPTIHPHDGPAHGRTVECGVPIGLALGDPSRYVAVYGEDCHATRRRNVSGLGQRS